MQMRKRPTAALPPRSVRRLLGWHSLGWHSLGWPLVVWPLALVLIGPGCVAGKNDSRGPVRPATSSEAASPDASLSASVSAPDPGVSDPAPLGHGVQIATVVAANLAAPWGIAQLPDGSALVTVRDTARVLLVGLGRQPANVALVSGVRPYGEGGLLGIAISPVFERDRYAFVYYTAADDNRIARYRYVSGEFRSRKVIVTGIPKSPIHNGGFLAFGPDGYLYAGTGDAGQSSRSQQWGSLGGKILRMTKAGKAPAGNPRAGNLAWSRGHRNVQGFGWDPRGRMFASEFGQNTWDELNLIVRGGNYGWPSAEGKGSDDRYRNPLVTWTTAEASPSGLAVTADAVYVAALRGESLWRVPFAGDGLGEPQRLLQAVYGRLRTVAIDAVGDFWILNSNTSRGDPTIDDDRVIVLPASALCPHLWCDQG
ncbi:MAG: PQQ-dependent sugar dehydrogenase [Candidatus Nanopelagicales bacterium]